MPTKPYPNESRMTALTRIEAGLDRLENHMITLAEANAVSRQMLEEDRAAIRAQFRPLAQVPLWLTGTH